MLYSKMKCVKIGSKELGLPDASFVQRHPVPWARSSVFEFWAKCQPRESWQMLQEADHIFISRICNDAELCTIRFGRLVQCFYLRCRV